MSRSGIVRVLDKDTITYRSPKSEFWHNVRRDDSVILNSGDQRELFFIKSYETTHGAAIRMAEMTGWEYHR